MEGGRGGGHFVRPKHEGLRAQGKHGLGIRDQLVRMRQFSLANFFSDFLFWRICSCCCTMLRNKRGRGLVEKDISSVFAQQLKRELCSQNNASFGDCDSVFFLCLGRQGHQAQDGPSREPAHNPALQRCLQHRGKGAGENTFLERKKILLYCFNFFCI